ncbi:hypothetical protein ABIE18_002695 [Arthrobacter sp. 2762]
MGSFMLAPYRQIEPQCRRWPASLRSRFTSAVAESSVKQTKSITTSAPSSTIRSPKMLARMSDRFPWMLALNPADQNVCANEILAAARASFATNQPHLAIAELTSWRETATAITAGLGKEPVKWLESAEAVERP